MHIIVADDDPITRRVLSKMLARYVDGCLTRPILARQLNEQLQRLGLV